MTSGWKVTLTVAAMTMGTAGEQGTKGQAAAVLVVVEATIQCASSRRGTEISSEIVQFDRVHIRSYDGRAYPYHRISSDTP